jgi:flagellar protein FlgJ
MALTEKQQNALREAAAAAVRCEKSAGCPAELSVAQWAVESGWGIHAPGNNCFGIKFNPARHARSQKLETTEVLPRARMEPGDRVDEELSGHRVRVRGPREFAAFDSLAGCFQEHALLIASAAPYEQAWARYRDDRDFDRLVRSVSGVYATEPLYSVTVLRIARLPQVVEAIAEARKA